MLKGHLIQQHFIFILTIAMTLFMSSMSQGQVTTKDFDDIQLYQITNANGVKIDVTNFGAIITSIVVPDRDGNMDDIALGYNDVKSYINAVDKPYFGSIVGRYGNRIAKGKFTLNGEIYTLAVNNGENHLHGGVIGFDKVVWDAKPVSGDGFSGVELSYKAKDMEEGYPGNLDIQVTYKLTDENALEIDYVATTDKATPVNLTQHTYFNLRGEGNGDILGHELKLNANRFTPVDKGLIPTGVLENVKGTPFDFTLAKPIGRDIGVEHQQLTYGGGYDHNFVICDEPGELKKAAEVYEPTTGRVLEVHTTEPGIQFYCGNFLDGRLKGKSGKPYIHRGGFCLETQHFPDSPNQPNFPSTILQIGEKYQTKTIFKFSTK